MRTAWRIIGWAWTVIAASATIAVLAYLAFCIVALGIIVVTAIEH